MRGDDCWAKLFIGGVDVDKIEGNLVIANETKAKTIVVSPFLEVIVLSSDRIRRIIVPMLELNGAQNKAREAGGKKSIYQGDADTVVEHDSYEEDGPGPFKATHVRHHHGAAQGVRLPPAAIPSATSLPPSARPRLARRGARRGEQLTWIRISLLLVLELGLTVGSTMALSRRFLNLIAQNHVPGVKTLRCIDLARQQLFDSTPPPPPPNGNSTNGTRVVDAGDQEKKQAMAVGEMEKILLPSPSFTFGASSSAVVDQWEINCFPLADRRLICTDQSGRALLLDVDAHHVEPMPNLHKPKWDPFSLFVPSPDPDDRARGGGILFVMEKIPEPESRNASQKSDQFEAFVYRKPNVTSVSKSWYGHLLPPPPYVREDTCSWSHRPKITSYAVLGGGSQICISAEGAGTYCLDTVDLTWRQVGKWTLPFHGKVEYVPELKLWFGLSAKAQILSAADLSRMDSRPQQMGAWNDLLHAPEGWKKSQGSQLVSLGSGKFCIARFFLIMSPNTCLEDEVIQEEFAVLTGLEVVPRECNGSDGTYGDGSCHRNRNGNMKLRMIQHKSKVLDDDDGNVIDVVF
ncbi:hypothetical protein ACP70R_020162 [Stipagrostis hirtigluma subsp. patula]